MIHVTRRFANLSLVITQSPLPKATVFTEAEQAALALAEEGTRLADAQPGVSVLAGPGGAL